MDPKPGIFRFISTDRIAGGDTPGAKDFDFWGPTEPGNIFTAAKSVQKVSDIAAELCDSHLDIGRTLGIRRIRINYWVPGSGLTTSIFAHNQFLLISLNFKSPVAQTPAAKINWTFAGKVAREAPGAFTEKDIGKVALQSDEVSWWVLASFVSAGSLQTPTWESQDLRSQIALGCVTWRPVLFFLPDGMSEPFRPWINVYNGVRDAKDQRILFDGFSDDDFDSGFVRRISDSNFAPIQSATRSFPVFPMRYFPGALPFAIASFSGGGFADWTADVIAQIGPITRETMVGGPFGIFQDDPSIVFANGRGYSIGSVDPVVINFTGGGFFTLLTTEYLNTD